MKKYTQNELLATGIAVDAVGQRALQASGVSPDLLDAASGHAYRGVSFHGLVDAVCASRGETTRRSKSEKADLYCRYTQNSEMMAAAGFSTMNLASIRDDAVNKVVRAKFDVIPSVIPAVCKEVDTPDFRPIHNYQLTSGSFLRKVMESGELEHMKMSDSKKSYEVEDSGGFLGIPRKYLVNDDMGIIKQLGSLLGTRGKQTLERDFHAMLLAATWTAANKITGGTSAFSYSALKLAHQLWADQQSDGAPIAIGGSVLLVQNGSMELDAKDLNKSERIMVRSDNTVDRAEANVFQGQFANVVGTPWFRHVSMGAAKSSTVWIEFSDPAVHSMFECAYLGSPDGEGRVPRVETQNMPFTSLGLQMRVLFTYGMGQVSDVGAVRADGA